MCLAQSANVVSMQSASSHVPEIGMESRSGLFSVLHPIMSETTGEQSIHRVRVWHHFCQRESEKLDVSAKRCDLWAFPPRIRTPWWCKSVTSVGTQAEVCAHQQEETQKTQHLYFFYALCDGSVPLKSKDNKHGTGMWCDSRATVNRRHQTLGEVRLVIHQVTQNSTCSLLWMYLFKCRFNNGLSNPFSAFFGEGLIQHAKNRAPGTPFICLEI